ncbi:protein FAM3D isoform X3 [Phalacrocorax aristotelis]|uniref:protein FAM3D isoform X3 n=1 Tax=Phalacrocorax aristotelis TaxID=126867 RepID=UPI003F4BF878
MPHKCWLSSCALVPGTQTMSPKCQKDALVPDPCCCCSHLAPLLPLAGIIRFVALLITLLGTWVIVQMYFDHRWKAISLRSWLGVTSKPRSEQLPRHKCGNKKSCPENYFAFKITSGAANVVGPSICFDDMILMSNLKNNIGRGLNIALVNGTNGQLLKADIFDMYSGDTDKLDTFLQEIKHGTIVLTASYDDAATKMNDKIRAHFVELGSSHVSKLGFRDNWVFLGAKGMKNKSPFEDHIKNDKDTNKYNGWPELLEMEGCAPKKMD